MNLLITGGAGYIGSHVVLAAIDCGYDVTVLDDLSTGSLENINPKIKFIHGSILSKQDLSSLFSNNKFDCVIHLAAKKAAGDSMLNPVAYSENNIIGSLNLINACYCYGVKNFVFSSTAAVYGKPEYIPIDEKHALAPANYYGYTKLIIEENLKWYCDLNNIRFASLRYFNAAGYDEKGRITSIEHNPQNLIPLVMEAALGIRPEIGIFGNDYDTKDGTCIRDYIHVTDLAKAHLGSIDYILKEDKNLIINLGTGRGYSVLEILNKVMNISGKNIYYNYQERRAGDPEIVIAKVNLAKELIKWEGNNSSLDSIIKSTWDVYKTKFRR